MKKKTGHAARHGYSCSPTYYAWHAMKKRCNHKHYWTYEYYGGRGITYDPRWEKFDNFLEDMGLKKSGQSLDRIDNNKDYSKENCRWATRSEQQRNKRNNRFVMFNGKVAYLIDAAKELGIYPGVLWRHTKDGTPVEIAVKKIKHTGEKFSFNGEKMTIRQASNKYGVPYYLIYSRIKYKGMSPSDSVTSDDLRCK